MLVRRHPIITKNLNSLINSRYSYYKRGSRMVSIMASNFEPVVLSKACKRIPPSIWVETLNLVNKYKPVNLGQGFPDFPEVVPTTLKNALVATQAANAPVVNNQYTRGQGNIDLVNAIADIYSPLFGRSIDAMKEVMVTVGAYEALHCIINAVVNPGDEVILIEPYFDSYSESILAINGVPRYIPLRLKEGGTNASDFVLDKNELTGLFNEKTKAIIVNTPHNPTGKVFTHEEIEFIGNLCKKYNALYISDEVYEWLVYQGSEHIRAATLPGMWERTVTVCSAGKTFSVTGWKSGWLIAPEYLISGAMRVHQGIIYTCPTPLQIALANTFKHEKLLLGTPDSYWHWLCQNMTGKRQRMFEIVKEAKMKPIMPDGGYFMLVDITGLNVDRSGYDDDTPLDKIVQQWLIKDKGLAVIPCSEFYSSEHKKEFENFIRVCFIKGDNTLDAAREIFSKLNIE
ncbi:kynurenine--oxoglutarate transaminase 3 isoform X1 [Hydra vulgaris]|uniref:kynurenine--oxoglutarate transaminase 3 isoform X1 n=2 Tax=Hydra vulgaris TaxID=6087 RepID=UPI001F5EA960|nr:kynurenine--oxoglutarate transaminase 3-like isoform X1 [Hydra vulgaris]